MKKVNLRIKFGVVIFGAIIFSCFATVLLCFFIKNTKFSKKLVISNSGTVQISAIGNKNLKLAKVVSASDIKNGKDFVELPRGAKNIEIKKVSSQDLKKISRQEKPKLSIEDRVALANSSNVKNLPNGMLANISQLLLSNANSIVENITSKNVKNRDGVFVNVSDQTKNINSDESILVEYETTSSILLKEEIKEEGKLVTVSYKNKGLEETIEPINVLAHATIPEVYKTSDKNNLKINWKNNDNQDVNFEVFDLNNNGRIDYIEWTVPHLSDQVFEIIYLSRAFRLDENKNVMEDVFNLVWKQDNEFATFLNGQYARITFEKILDNTKDITIYAKPTIEGKPAKIEVYKKDSNQLLATFENIDKNGKYRILLTNLDAPTYDFDLKIFGDVDIDFMLDPPITVYWVGASGGNISTATNWCTYNPTGCNADNGCNGGTGDSSTAPGSADTAIFDADCDNNATVDASWSLTTLTANAGYAGTISSANSISVSGDITISSGTLTITGTTAVSATNVTWGSNGQTTTINMGNGTWTVGGDLYYLYVSTTSVGSSTVLMTSASGNLTAGSSKYIKNLTIDAAASITVPVASAQVMISGLVTVDGDLIFGGSSEQLYIVGTSCVINTGGSVSGAGSLRFEGQSGGQGLTTLDGTLTANLTIVHPGSTAVWVAGTGWGGSVGISSYSSGTYTSNFNLSASNYVISGNLTVTVTSSTGTNTLNINNSTNNPNIEVRGTITLNQNTGGVLNWNKGSGTLTLGNNPSDGTQTFDFEGKTMEDIVVNGSGDTKQLTANAATTDSLTITAGTFNSNALGLTVSGLTTVNGGTYQSSTATQSLLGGLTFSSGTITQSTGEIDVGGNMTVSGTPTFTKNASGLLKFNSGTDQTLTSATRDLGNIQISASGGTNTILAMQDALNVDNVTIDSNQTFSNGGGTLAITCGGNWSDSGSFTEGTGTVTFDGTAQTISTAETFYHLVVSSSTQLDITSVTINSYDTNVTSGKTLRIDNASDRLNATTMLYLNGGTITQSAGTVNPQGTATSYDGVYNIGGTYTISGGALTIARSYNGQGGILNISDSAAITVGSYFYEYSGYSANRINMTGGTVTCANFPNYAGIVTHTGGTITSTGYYYDANGGLYYGSGTAILQVAGYFDVRKAGTYFFNVEANGASTYIHTSTTQVIDINGSFTINSGKSFDTNSELMSVAGNWSNQGTFIADSGTVTFDGNGAGQTISGSTTFYNFTKTDPSNDSTDAVLTVTAGTTQTVSNIFTVTGIDSNDRVNLVSSSPGTPWLLTSDGTSNVTWADVTDSNAGSGFAITNTNSISGGNNTNWLPHYDQKHFRIYRNNGGLILADYYAAEDANCTIGLSTIFRIRFEVANDAVGESLTGRLEFKEDAGVWTQITTGTNNVRLADSSYFADGAATTTRLTATGTFTAGQGKDTGSDVSQTVSSGYYTEDEYSIMMQPEAAGHTYQFRMTHGGTELSVYSAAVTISNVDSVAPIPSSFNPVDGFTIKTATPSISFTLDEGGDCFAATTDSSYDDMSGDVNCTGDGSTGITCKMTNLGANGSKTIYFSCRDLWGNKDTAATNHSVTYTLNAEATNNATIKGKLRFNGKIRFGPPASP